MIRYINGYQPLFNQYPALTGELHVSEQFTWWRFTDGRTLKDNSKISSFSQTLLLENLIMGVGAPS